MQLVESTHTRELSFVTRGIDCFARARDAHTHTHKTETLRRRCCVQDEGAISRARVETRIITSKICLINMAPLRGRGGGGGGGT